MTRCVLRRCAVIAAANPVGGHYDRGKTVNENLKMPRAILSRFDVIFILLDDPDADRDRLLSVTTLHAPFNLLCSARIVWVPTRSRDVPNISRAMPCASCGLCILLHRVESLTRRHSCRARALQEHVMALHSNRHSHSTATSQAPSMHQTPAPTQRRPAKFGNDLDDDSPSLFSRLQLRQVTRSRPLRKLCVSFESDECGRAG